MPQPSRRKQKRAPEIYPSSVTREVYSSGRRKGVLVKKRTFEPVIPASPFSFPSDDDLIPEEVLSQSSDERDVPKKQKPAHTSRSVSVSAACAYDVDNCSPTSRQELKSGFHTGASTSMNFFVLDNPAPSVNQANVNQTSSIIVLAVFRESRYARIV